MASNFISPCFPHFFPFQMHLLPTFSPSKMQFSSDHSLFTTVQSDDDSWFDAGTKQFFDPAAGGSTHSSPLPYSWSPPLSEADLPHSSHSSAPPLAADLLYLPSFRTLLFSSKPPLPSAARRCPVLPQLPQQCSPSSHSSHSSLSSSQAARSGHSFRTAAANRPHQQQQVI